VVAAWFLLAPLHLLNQSGLRLLLVYGVIAPLVGVLLLLRHTRARFAAYVFLSMDMLRSAAAGNVYLLLADIAILAYLQLPRMRRVYPGINARAVVARWKR